jgi:hypothetical protein
VAYDWPTDVPGLFAYHAERCTIRDTGVCSCGTIGFRAGVRDPEDGTVRLGPLFTTADRAREWQLEESGMLDASVSSDGPELRSVIADLIAAAENGGVREPDGTPYTRDGVRRLRADLSYVDAELGSTGVRSLVSADQERFLESLRRLDLDDDRVGAIVNAAERLFDFAGREDLAAFAETRAPWPAAAPEPPVIAGDFLPPWDPPPTEPAWPYGDQQAGRGAQPQYVYPPAPPTLPSPVAAQAWGGLTDTFGGFLMPVDPAADATDNERLVWWVVRLVIFAWVLIGVVLVVGNLA